MKRNLIAIVPVFSLLIFAAVFNIVQHKKSKVEICEVSKYCLGVNIEKSFENGSNRAIYILKKPGKCTVGNTKKIIFTWHMN